MESVGKVLSSTFTGAGVLFSHKLFNFHLPIHGVILLAVLSNYLYSTVNNHLLLSVSRITISHWLYITLLTVASCGYGIVLCTFTE